MMMLSLQLNPRRSVVDAIDMFFTLPTPPLPVPIFDKFSFFIHSSLCPFAIMFNPDSEAFTPMKGIRFSGMTDADTFARRNEPIIFEPTSNPFGESIGDPIMNPFRRLLPHPSTLNLPHPPGTTDVLWYSPPPPRVGNVPDYRTYIADLEARIVFLEDENADLRQQLTNFDHV